MHTITVKTVPQEVKLKAYVLMSLSGTPGSAPKEILYLRRTIFFIRNKVKLDQDLLDPEELPTSDASYYAILSLMLLIRFTKTLAPALRPLPLHLRLLRSCVSLLTFRVTFATGTSTSSTTATLQYFVDVFDFARAACSAPTDTTFRCFVPSDLVPGPRPGRRAVKKSRFEVFGDLPPGGPRFFGNFENLLLGATASSASTPPPSSSNLGRRLRKRIRVRVGAGVFDVHADTSSLDNTNAQETQATSTLTIEFEPQAQLIKVTPTVITLPAVVLPLEVEQHYSHLRHPFRWYNNVAIAECSSMLRGRDGGGRDNRKDAGEAGALLRCQAQYAEMQAYQQYIGPDISPSSGPRGGGRGAINSNGTTFSFGNYRPERETFPEFVHRAYDASEKCRNASNYASLVDEDDVDVRGRGTPIPPKAAVVLDDLLQTIPTEVEHLSIDAQGLDVALLRSLRLETLRKTAAIRLECQRSFGDAAAEADSFFLYEPFRSRTSNRTGKGVPLIRQVEVENDCAAAEDFLREAGQGTTSGFRLESAELNNCACNEWNLLFRQVVDH